MYTVTYVQDGIEITKEYQTVAAAQADLYMQGITRFTASYTPDKRS